MSGRIRTKRGREVLCQFRSASIWTKKQKKTKGFYCLSVWWWHRSGAYMFPIRLSVSLDCQVTTWVLRCLIYTKDLVSASLHSYIHPKSQCSVRHGSCSVLSHYLLGSFVYLFLKKTYYAHFQIHNFYFGWLIEYFYMLKCLKSTSVFSHCSLLQQCIPSLSEALRFQLLSI